MPGGSINQSSLHNFSCYLWRVVIHARQKQSDVDFISGAVSLSREDAMSGAAVWLGRVDLKMVEEDQ